jgi:hypothetical protein
MLLFALAAVIIVVPPSPLASRRSKQAVKLCRFCTSRVDMNDPQIVDGGWPDRPIQ